MPAARWIWPTNTRRFTATRIEYGAAFTHQTSGTIDDASGLIRNLGGLTTRGGVGFVDFQDLTVLLAAWTGPGGAASPQAAVTAAIVPRETGTAALRVNRRSAVSKRRRSIERWLIDLSRAVFSRDKLAFSAKGQ
ncbi:MAG: hypothetical protein IID44_19025 [Planctomycetes bacterium]|nr:hypothetical protein [Planctomycetota bacterium]